MQPYFIPYLGYFRLIAETDLFVIYDCVQYPRRGWVHRNRLINANGHLDWLTLPLAKAPFDGRIDELRFRDEARIEITERGHRFPAFEALAMRSNALLPELLDPTPCPTLYLARLLQSISEAMGLTWNAIRSSSLEIDPDVRGQDRILEIARRVEATKYVNAPGGRDIYDKVTFDRAGISLRFLEPYDGPTTSVLQRLYESGPRALGRELTSALT